MGNCQACRFTPCRRLGDQKPSSRVHPSFKLLRKPNLRDPSSTGKLWDLWLEVIAEGCEIVRKFEASVANPAFRFYLLTYSWRFQNLHSPIRPVAVRPLGWACGTLSTTSRSWKSKIWEDQLQSAFLSLKLEAVIQSFVPHTLLNSIRNERKSDRTCFLFW